MSSFFDSAFKNKKLFIVLAHPDDEIIFTNSILKKAAKIIICFQDIPGESEISNGRYRCSLNYPLNNFMQLGLKQARFSGKIINWNKPKETKYGIDGYLNKRDYVKNFYYLFEKLSELLTKDVLVITHNPWGEYGHPEHIQVNRVVSELAKKIKFKFFVTGIAGTSTQNYAFDQMSKLTDKYAIFETDKSLYKRIKNFYVANNCWTWFDIYDLPKNEIFFEQINNDIFPSQRTNKISLLPIYFIKNGNNFSRNLVHFLKVFMPLFLKKKFRNIKLKNDK